MSTTVTVVVVGIDGVIRMDWLFMYKHIMKSMAMTIVIAVIVDL